MIDFTLGAGGHAVEVLARLGKDARLVGFDRDVETLEVARRNLQVYNQQAQLVHDSYANFDLHLAPEDKGSVDFILIDLGLSSLQLEQSSRGFAHQSPSDPLDLRFDATQGVPAAALIARTSAFELARVLSEFGEIQRSWKIAEAIFKRADADRLHTVADLVHTVLPFAPRERTKQFLSQVWQALRIWVNDELGQLQIALPKAEEYLKPEGILAVISFHSLEDRMVKQFMIERENPCICPPRAPICVCGRQPSMKRITRKAIKPSDQEIESNPRSRSARLRAAIKIGTS